jgi:predicted RNA-binding protein (virulence factor B family)
MQPTPPPAVGRFALLKVAAVQSMGAFLEWGRPDQLFLPTREQTEPVSAGEEVVVYVFLDKTERPVASMHLSEFLDTDTRPLRLEQRVDLLIYAETPLGFQAIINDRYPGVLYHSEVFQTLDYGTRLPGYIKHIREDGKVDLILQPLGIKGSQDLGRQILERLKERGGFLPLTDKSTPETIYALFGVSKKKYKMALGGLYKNQQIRIENEGIRLQGPV